MLPVGISILSTVKSACQAVFPWALCMSHTKTLHTSARALCTDVN